MNGNKNTLIVTCLYSKLYETKLGGRYNRLNHYIESLKTLSNLNVDIILYTSEEEKDIILKEHEIINNEKIKIKVYDLYSDINHNFFQKKIKENNIKNSFRCYEIMHGKIKWMNNHVNDGYEYIYWVDVGLSHAGLFPIRYRGSESEKDYYKCSLFNPKIIENLNLIDGKIVLIGGNQDHHTFERNFCSSFNVELGNNGNYHIIGGLFGGNFKLVNELYKKYENLLNEMFELDILLYEEQILTVLYYKYTDLFYLLEFTTWHHEDSDMSKYNNENEKYFYNIFEELNK